MCDITESHRLTGQRLCSPYSAPFPILFLHGRGKWLRGSEHVLLTTLQRLDRTRFSPVLVCGNDALARAARGSGIDTVTLQLPEIMLDRAYIRMQVLRWATTTMHLRSLIRTRSIQLVYCNGGSTHQVGYYAAKLAGIPTVCHVHFPYDRRYVLLYRLHRATKALFVSRSTEDSTRRKQVFRGRTEVVHNGIDVFALRPPNERDLTWRERFEIPSDAVVFGQVSSLIMRKGIDLLLRAFQLLSIQYPGTRLVLVGDGPDRRDFEKLAADLGIHRKVVFAGDQQNPLPFYQHVIDIHVLASRGEAFPLSLLEASACGLPNIAANVAGVPESVSDGETGLLFEPGNHPVLAEKMSLLAGNDGMRKALGHAGFRRARQCFSTERYIASIERILLEEIEFRHCG